MPAYSKACSKRTGSRHPTRSVFTTSTYPACYTTGAFLPLLRGSEAPVIVNVSSGLGSFGVVNDPERHEFGFAISVYGSSKAAVGMLTV